MTDANEKQNEQDAQDAQTTGDVRDAGDAQTTGDMRDAGDAQTTGDAQEDLDAMVLMVNGSMNPDGNTNRALTEIGLQLEKEGIGFEIFQLGADPIRDCIGCRQCDEETACIFEDDGVNEFVAEAREASGFVFGTPVYFAHPSGRILSFLDRAFYGGSNKVFTFKPAASVAVARRGGTTASFDALNKYFGISQMPVAGSTYWNLVHGHAPGEAEQDAEGLQTMRNLARNLAWMIKCFRAGAEAGVSLPETESGSRTNFIR